MALYAVTYDIRGNTFIQTYNRIFDYLKTAYAWCTPLYSFWIIESDIAPSEIIRRATANGVIDDNDGFMVLELTGVGDFRRVRSDGAYPSEAADWLKQRIIIR